MKHRHFILYKPFGVLSQFVNNKTRKKKLLSDVYNFPDGTMAIGRLDANSEGLLFLTTDGLISEEIRSNKVEKEYYVQVDGEINSEALNKLQKGIEINIYGKKHLTLQCTVNHLKEVPKFPARSKKIRDARHGPTSWLSITLTEGKFRQIRKMTAAVGLPTLRLIRIRIGEILLSEIKEGEVIEVESFNSSLYNTDS